MRGDADATVAAFVQSAWEVFARFGMGPAARTDGPELSGIVADFNPPSPPSTSVVRASASPALAIPDADAQGVVSALTLPDAGTVRALTVDVTITHPYRGDLVVTLVAPDGRAAVLHDRAGGGADNLRRAYDSASVAALAQLLGTPAGGGWTLRVADLAPDDVGRLDAWSLAAEVGPAAPPSRAAVALGAAVPSGAQGVDSELEVPEPGAAAEVTLSVDITHAHAGDLGVTLRGPTGKRVMVHRRGGAERDSLITSYGSDDGQPLAAFVG
ncbi:MAG TPA: proprotein convertase P-domain-containing protein, partial [Dactylosporangium sp.]|nr:proprotein convertase P-domain-containing protein [Dactylosporangium sp.]